jgi:hypothetical protein
MQKLVKAYKPKELTERAYLLYERFRPDIPAGKKGWGAKGDLDLGLIEQLAKEKGCLLCRRITAGRSQSSSG